MSKLKPELSRVNQWWLPKHRYYELVHWCLQYPDWKKLYSELEYRIKSGTEERFGGNNDPVAEVAIRRAELRKYIDTVERSAMEADRQLYNYILMAVTEGKSFTELKMLYGIPCERDMFYDRRRKFFYILSRRKGA